MVEPRIIQPDDPTTAPEGPSGAPERANRTKKYRELQVRVYDFYMNFSVPMQYVAQAKMASGDPMFAMATQNYIEKCPLIADQWVTLAEQNPRIEMFLTRMMDGSVIGTLVMTHVSILVPFLPPHILSSVFSFLPGMNGDNGNGNDFDPAAN